MHLHIPRTSPFQALVDRGETVPIGIEGMHLPLVFHDSGQRQRLSARARTEIENLFARLGEDEFSGNLAAFILDFEPALLIARLGLEVRQ